MSKSSVSNQEECSPEHRTPRQMPSSMYFIDSLGSVQETNSKASLHLPPPPSVTPGVTGRVFRRQKPQTAALNLLMGRLSSGQCVFQDFRDKDLPEMFSVSRPVLHYHQAAFWGKTLHNLIPFSVYILRSHTLE